MGFGFGFDIMSALFPILFLAVFAIILVTIISSLAAGAKQKRKNDQSPRVTAPAKVVSKRMQVGRNEHYHNDDGMMHGYNYSKYFATFEFEGGDRLELPVDGSDYGLLVEGDYGKLTFQGTRYLGFTRGSL